MQVTKCRLLLLCLFSSTTLFAQNLVINGDLEEIRKMPLPQNMAIDGIRLEFEEDSSYFQPLLGTHSPLANVAAPGWQYTTYNSVAFSASYSNAGYSRSGTNLKILKVYRGSTEGRNATVSNAVASLCRPLIAGKQYQVTFYLKPFSGKAFTNNIGVSITSERYPINFQFAQEKPSKKHKLPNAPAIKPDYKLSEILTDTSDYTEISFTYTANGGETYVYIGNLFFDTDAFWKKDSWQQTEHFGYEHHNGRFFVCYYALDDLSVIPLDTAETLCTTTPTDTIIGLPDTTYVGSVFYETDSSTALSDLSSEIQKIQDAPHGYHVLVIGHTDQEGNPEYNQKLSKKRAEGIKTIISQKVDIPVIAIGMGDKQPLKTADITQNRRVEIYLVKD